MATKTKKAPAWKRQAGRPGKAKLPCRKAANGTLAARNRRIVKAVSRTRKPLTQAEAGEQFGIDQSIVSEIVRNPCSGKVK